MANPGFKECPYCAEEIREAAVICRFCKSPQPGADPSKLPPSAASTTASDEPAPKSEAERNLQEQVDRLKKFVPAKVMQRLTDGFADAIEEGERRNITVMFGDLCGFTALSEALDPEDLAELMEQCYGEMNRVIDKYDGTIDKFIGDCVMALFGAPVAHEDDPERAIRAGLEIRDAIRAIGKKFGYDLDLSVGINSGEVVVKSFGDSNRADYSALGDAVNLASRLQGKANRGEVLVSKAIWARTRSLFEWVDVAPFTVKGKSEPITAFIAAAASERFAKEVQLRERVEMVDYVGRTTELETLLGNWRTVQRGRRRVVKVVGEAGVGKSRLVYEFFKRARESSDAEIRRFTGRCLSFGQHMAMLPIIEMVKEVADIKEGDTAPTVTEKLAKCVDDLATKAKNTLTTAEQRHLLDALEFLLALRQTSSPLMKLTPRDRQRALFESIQTLVGLIARQGPFIIVLEDLHWADEQSIALIDHLLSTDPPDTPVLVMILARPVLAHQFPNEDNITRIHLSELDEEESAELLRRLCRLHELPVDLEQQILAKTEGNPFYVEEIVLNLQEAGILVREGESWVFAKDLKRVDIPETVQGVILARVDRLETQVRRLLQCASVIGTSFRQRVLTQVAEIREKFEEMLTELVDIEFIFEKTALPELTYLFKHIVTQEVVYGTLLRRRRSAFHGRVAEAIEALYHDRLDEHIELLAHHWYLSENLPKARHALWEAGQKCQRMYANEAAIDFYEKLLKTLEKGEMDEVERLRMRSETLRELGMLHMIIGKMHIAAKRLHESIEVADSHRDCDAIRARALMNLGQVLRIMGELADARQALTSASELFAQFGNDVSVRSCIQSLGVIAQVQGDYDTALGHYQAYLKGLDKEDGTIDRAYRAHSNIGIVQMLRGNTRGAKTHLSEALALAEEQTDRRGRSEATYNLGLVFIREGHYDNAKAHLVEAHRLAHEIGYQRVQLACDIAMSEIYNFTGETKVAIHHCQRALDFAIENGHAEFISTARGNWARALCTQGDNDAAAAMGVQALTDAKRVHDHIGQINALMVIADARLALGQHAQAEKAAREALKLNGEAGDDEMRPQVLRVLAEALAARGNDAESTKALKSALEAAEAKGDPRDIAWVQAARATHLKSKDAATKAKAAAKRLAKRIGDEPLLARLAT